MISQSIFYIIFTSQIVLISLILPTIIYRRIQSLIINYPPSEYPKLYPRSPDIISRVGKIYLLSNYTIVLAGFTALGLILSDIWSYAITDKNAQRLPGLFGLLQAAPIILLELSTQIDWKVMRKNDNRKVRSTPLESRKLFDFVSPLFVGLAFLLLTGYVITELALQNFPPQQFIHIGIIVGINIFFVAFIAFLLRGKKLDPHQAHEDRVKQMKFTIRSIIYTSIGISLYMSAITALWLLDALELKAILISLFWQCTVLFTIGYMLIHYPLKNINFESYKTDTSLTN